MLRFVLAMLLPHASIAASPDAKELLQKIAATYQSVLDYRTVVETNVTSTVDPQATKCRYELIASKPKMMFTDERVLSPIKYEVRLGTDGNAVWAYSRTEKLYELGSTEDGDVELAGELRQQHFRLFRKFEEL